MDVFGERNDSDFKAREMVQDLLNKKDKKR